MRAEKVFGYVGLGFFFLFPLVSLLQLRDNDDAWRQVASRVRPSVLSLHPVSAAGSTQETAPIASGILLGRDPLRVAVAGRPSSERLASPTSGGWVQWQTVYEDPQGDFAILQAAADHAALAAPPGQAALAPARVSQSAAAPVPAEDPREGIPAALVAPEHLRSMPIWVGVLTPLDGADGRRAYNTELLRPVQNADILSSAHAATDPQPDLDPVLRGAPFVGRDGSVVALYIGARDGRSQAVPIAPIRAALEDLERRAER